MFTIYKKTIPIIILYAIALHVVTAICLFLNPSVLHITSLEFYLVFFDGWSLVHIADVTAWIFLCVAGLAASGLFEQDALKRFWLMLPQQVILILSCKGPLQSMITAQFADGIVRTHTFLVADQLPALLTAIGHIIALIVLTV